MVCSKGRVIDGNGYRLNYIPFISITFFDKIIKELKMINIYLNFMYTELIVK